MRKRLKSQVTVPKFPKTEAEWAEWGEWYRLGRKPKKAIRERGEPIIASKQLSHGTRSGYKRSCRCDDCIEAQRLYQRRYRASLPKLPKLPKLLNPSVVELDCVVCGRQFDYESRQGARPQTCSTECKRERARQRARLKPQRRRRLCEVVCDGKPCGRRVSKLGLCNTHVYRLEKGLLFNAPILGRGGPGVKRGGVRVDKPCSYSAAHARCKRMWGSASLHACVKCGEQASDWAYDGTDPTELCGHGKTPAKGWSRNMAVMYSQYPEFFMPLCRKCHAEVDAVWRRGLREEFDEFLQRRSTG